MADGRWLTARKHREFRREFGASKELCPVELKAKSCQELIFKCLVKDISQSAELPGTRAEDIELALGSGLLKIKGRRSEPNGIPEERYRRQERFRGDWERTLSIPDRVREEGLSAEFVDGILRVHLPKGEQSHPRRIRVSEGSD